MISQESWDLRTTSSCGLTSMSAR